MLRKIKKVSKQLNKASKLHKKQSNVLKKLVTNAQKKRPKSRNRKKTKR
jgi:hypothetical protein